MRKREDAMSGSEPASIRTKCTTEDVPTVFVTIPEADYRHLLECKRRLEGGTAVVLPAARLPIRSPIDLDRDVALFLARRFGLKPVRTILAECEAEFGQARTPSSSAAHRFWLRLRKVGGYYAPQEHP